MFFIDPSTAIGLAETLFERETKLKRMAARAYNRVRRRHIRIMAFGPGGTGKTTLGHLFRENFQEPVRPGVYERSLKIEEYSLPGSLVCTLFVAPGQERYREEESQSLNNWTELYQEMMKGKSAGIINVVSWGYHSLRSLEIEETKHFKPGMSREDFMVDYLAARRQKEIEVVRELIHPIRAAPGKVWMMTLVTKQDLWWEQRNEVSEFYRTGEYDAAIREIMAHKGQESFRHEVVSASLVMNNFSTPKGEVLAPTVAGYDENIRLLNLRNVAKIVNESIGAKVQNDAST